MGLILRHKVLFCFLFLASIMSVIEKVLVRILAMRAFVFSDSSRIALGIFPAFSMLISSFNIQ